MKTVSLDDGKYEFDIGDSGLMVAARRYGEKWDAGFEMRFQNAFMYALYRILELEEKESE